MLNGYTLVWLENPHRLGTSAWIPGTFWAYEAAIQERTVTWAALGGLILGLPILGGQMQFIFAAGLILSLYGLTSIGNALLEDRTGTWQHPICLAFTRLIGLGSGSLVLLPAGEFAGVSQRGGTAQETIQNTRWPLPRLVTLFAPDFHGNRISDPYWRPANYAQMTAYLGVVALLLAMTAPLIARKRPFRGCRKTDGTPGGTPFPLQFCAAEFCAAKRKQVGVPALWSEPWRETQRV